MGEAGGRRRDHVSRGGRGSGHETRPGGGPARDRGGDGRGRGHGSRGDGCRRSGGGGALMGPVSASVVVSLGEDQGPDAPGEGYAMTVKGLGHLGAMVRGGAQAV